MQRTPAGMRGGHGRQLFTEREILELLVTLHEAPTLLGPETLPAWSTARYRGESTRDRLAAYGMNTAVRVRYDSARKGYRWLLLRDDDGRERYR